MKGAVILFRDVSHFRKVEKMRRDFVANVSHELRTPLSIFRGYLETLLDDPQQPPGELLRILEIMERHSNRLNALVEDVLSLARLESPGMELNRAKVDLPELLHSIMRDWEKPFAAKQLKSHLNFPGNLPRIEADETRLQELIYNLLDNAVKYSKAGGTVSLRAEPDGATVRISVADQGAGIPREDLPRIFERFYRADKSRSAEQSGTGLGLSIVKHIAQLHGGTVEAQSELGKGTTVSVTLPTSGAAKSVTQT
jgi:two-component system phosphate regulon sensor histidine kinase PhoR